MDNGSPIRGFRQRPAAPRRLRLGDMNRRLNAGSTDRSCATANRGDQGSHRRARSPLRRRALAARSLPPRRVLLAIRDVRRSEQPRRASSKSKSARASPSLPIHADGHPAAALARRRDQGSRAPRELAATCVLPPRRAPNASTQGRRLEMSDFPARDRVLSDWHSSCVRQFFPRGPGLTDAALDWASSAQGD